MQKREQLLPYAYLCKHKTLHSIALSLYLNNFASFDHLFLQTPEILFTINHVLNINDIKGIKKHVHFIFVFVFPFH